MDVRRQARLTAAVPSSPSLSPLVGSSALTPVPAYIPAYTQIATRAPHVPQVVHGEDTAAFGSVAVRSGGSRPEPPSRQLRQQQQQPQAVQRRSDGRFMPGIADGPIRKDRRKDRHKRASDGRNPMIRLNPSTADRFFAVQRLLESKRLKKTSGSFVINWLIDVAHASIQAVLQQGAESSEQRTPQQGSQQQQHQQQQQQHQQEPHEQHPQQDQPQSPKLAPSPGFEKQQQPTLLPDPKLLNTRHSHDAPGAGPDVTPPAYFSHDSLQERRHQERKELDFSQRSPARHNPGGLSLQPPGLSAYLTQSSAGGDEEEEEELLVEDTEPPPMPPQVHLAAAQHGMSFDISHAAHRPEQRGYSAADIARTALASAEAAEEGDDEDEEVDVVADGDGDEGMYARGLSGGDPSVPIQQLSNADVVWMRTGRSYAYYGVDGQQGGADGEEDADP